MAAAPKTQKTTSSVAAFLDAVPDETRRKDAKAVAKLMAKVTGEKAAMWGGAIVGYGAYASNTGAWPIVAFSPRKANLVLYVLADFKERDALLAKLGKHKTGKSCLYINKLADVDEAVLEQLIAQSVAHMKKKHG